MTGPLNYRNGRQFPQDILDDLDHRLKLLEGVRAGPNPRVQELLKIAMRAGHKLAICTSRKQHESRYEYDQFIKVLDEFEKLIDGDWHVS